MANRRQSSRRSAAKNQKDTIYYDEAEVNGMFEDTLDDEDADDSDEDPTFEEPDGDYEEDFNPQEEESDDDDPPMSPLGKRKREVKQSFNSSFKKQRTDTPMTTEWIIRKHQTPSTSPLYTPAPNTQNSNNTFQNIALRGKFSSPQATNILRNSFIPSRPVSLGQMSSPMGANNNSPISRLNSLNSLRMPNNPLQSMNNIMHNDLNPLSSSTPSNNLSMNNLNHFNHPLSSPYDSQSQSYIPPPVVDSPINSQEPEPILTPDQIAAENQVKQLLFDHFQRTTSGVYNRDASLALLKQQIGASPDYVEALKRIQAKAKSKGTATPGLGGPPMQPMQRQPFGIHGVAGSNQFVPSTLGSHLGHPVINTPIPPLVKQTLNAKMASSLFQTSNNIFTSSLSASQNNELNKSIDGSAAGDLNASTSATAENPTEEKGEESIDDIDLSSIDDVDKKIEITMKRCEAISIRLRESLQKHLQPLLDEAANEKDPESCGIGVEMKSEAAEVIEPVKIENKTALTTLPDDPKPEEQPKEQDSIISNWFSSLTPKKQGSSTEIPSDGIESTEGDLKIPEEDKTEDEPAKKFSAADSYIVREQPNILQLALKEYQLVGLNWLNLLNHENVNGILADEMGLGKTVQTISLFALLYERKGGELPHLVICPSTTLTNWMRELHRWCPVLRVIAYYGSPAERDLAKKTIISEHFDIILTTYNVAGQKKDRLFLKRQDFHYVVLDEAQNIKNNQSLRHKYLRKLKSQHRLLLTGTPLQNNLDELWALLQFIMPDLFHFDVEFNEDNSDLNDQRVNKMKAIMAPFVLRRLKQQVSRGLPQKAEKLEYCQMTEIQQRLYRTCIQSSRSWWEKVKREQFEEIEVDSDDMFSPEFEGENGDDGEEKPKRKPRKKLVPKKKRKDAAPVSFGKTLSNVFMELRKIANHPLLIRNFYEPKTIGSISSYLSTLEENSKKKPERIFEDLCDLSDFRIHQICKEKEQLAKYLLSPQQLECSGKAVLFKNLLVQLKAGDHRVLVFSQMTRVLDILQELLGIWGYVYIRLDGSTPVAIRQNLIDKFNTDKTVFIFLLSTRAGGVGINLTAADTVIFYDVAFNPQVDRQAEDRCHRFGQEKPVTIYKMITSNTVDQHMLSMADRKAKLNDIMLEEGTKKKENTKVWQLRSLLSSVFEDQYLSDDAQDARDAQEGQVQEGILEVQGNPENQPAV